MAENAVPLRPDLSESRDFAGYLIALLGAPDALMIIGADERAAEVFASTKLGKSANTQLFLSKKKTATAGMVDAKRRRGQGKYGRNDKAVRLS